MKKLIVLIAALIAAIGMLRIAFVLPRRAMHDDFSQYFLSSKVWLDGGNPYATSLKPLADNEGWELNPRIVAATNPPPLIVTFALLVRAGPRAAYWTWVALEIIALMATLWLCWFLLGSAKVSGQSLLLGGALVASEALYYHFYFSQVQLQIGALLLGAHTLMKRERHRTALLLASVAGALKLFPFCLWPWFFWRAGANMRARLARSIPSLVLLVLVGWATRPLWPDFVHQGIGVVQGNVINQTWNFSLFSFVVNLGHVLCGFEATPTTAAWIWRAAGAVALVVLTVGYGGVVVERADRHLSFCLLLLLSLLCSPTAWGHYFVLTFFPFCVLAERVARAPSAAGWVSVGAVYAFVVHLLNFGGRFGRPILRLLVTYMPMAAASALAIWFWSQIRNCGATQNCRERV